jgi:hypothetical protein
LAYLDSRVLDLGLNVLDVEATILHICSSEPANYAGIAAITLGNKASVSIGAPGARAPSGRKVTVAAITDGAVTGTGTASHYAIADAGNTRLLAAGALAATQAVTNGNTFTLAAFDIGIPGPA